MPLTGEVPISGSKNAALKMLAAATLTGERCRFTNVPEIEDVRVMAETLRDLGVVVDHPADNVYEVASGDVEWLFVPLEAAAKMRASLHAPRAAPQPLRPGDHQQPGRRPDRPPAGRPPRRGDADARGDDRIPQRLLLRHRAGPAPRDRDPLPLRVGHGHGERDARRDAGRRPHGHPAGRPRARGRRPDRLPPEDGRRGGADLPRHDRGRGQAPPARRRAPRRRGPDRGGNVRDRGRRHRRPGDAHRRAVRPDDRSARGVRPGGRRRDLRGRSGRDRRPGAPGRRLPGLRHRDRALSRASRPTSSPRPRSC